MTAGRPRIYNTEEERLAALRASRQRYEKRNVAVRNITKVAKRRTEEGKARRRELYRITMDNLTETQKQKLEEAKARRRARYAEKKLKALESQHTGSTEVFEKTNESSHE